MRHPLLPQQDAAANRRPVPSAQALQPHICPLSCREHVVCSLQETNQEVPGWLQGMGARAPSFGGGKRRGGGGNRFGGQDFRRDTGSHCETACSLCMS